MASVKAHNIRNKMSRSHTAPQVGPVVAATAVVASLKPTGQKVKPNSSKIHFAVDVILTSR